jgi:hypothetical protein
MNCAYQMLTTTRNVCIHTKWPEDLMLSLRFEWYSLILSRMWHPGSGRCLSPLPIVHKFTNYSCEETSPSIPSLPWNLHYSVLSPLLCSVLFYWNVLVDTAHPNCCFPHICKTFHLFQSQNIFYRWCNFWFILSLELFSVFHYLWKIIVNACLYFS